MCKNGIILVYAKGEVQQDEKQRTYANVDISTLQQTQRNSEENEKKPRSVDRDTIGHH